MKSGFELELQESEIFSLLGMEISQAIDTLEDPRLGQANLPTRDYQVKTLRGFHKVLLVAKLAKYGAAITCLHDRIRDARRDYARAFDADQDYLGNPPAQTRQSIVEWQKQIEQLNTEAQAIALHYGWEVRGSVDPETGEYAFAIVNTLKTMLTRRYSNA